MHAMCLLPSCGGDAEGLSATTFDADLDVHRPGVILPQASACATPASSNLKLQGQRQGLKPRHIQHGIQDAKGDGKGSSARSAQPRRLTGAWRHNFMAEYAFEK